MSKKNNKFVIEYDESKYMGNEDIVKLRKLFEEDMINCGLTKAFGDFDDRGTAFQFWVTNAEEFLSNVEEWADEWVTVFVTPTTETEAQSLQYELIYRFLHDWNGEDCREIYGWEIFGVNWGKLEKAIAKLNKYHGTHNEVKNG